jgi:inorganic pyrophosphatase
MGLSELIHLMFQAHPWHGVSPGAKCPDEVETFIEIVPTDTVKYELDKPSGLLRVDRPQRYSSLPPTLYGFIPQTWCGPEIAQRCSERTGLGPGIVGDGDPLDICVLTEKAVQHGNILMRTRPIGGFRMVDAMEADDKIIAVLVDDVSYGSFQSLDDCPRGLIERLRHYFLSYKQIPGTGEPRRVQIAEVYDRAEAHEVIRRSINDYRAKYGAPEGRVDELKRLIGG